MYPLKFETIFKTVVWGGEKIDPIKGVETEQHNIGESWELSGVKGNESVVAEGALAGKTITEDPGVMPNPTVEKLEEGVARARACNANLILAVGGGSVCDYAKGVAVATHCPEDAWEKYYVRMEPLSNPVIPVGCVLTMAGTGSEMNGGSVITNHATKRKIGRVFDDRVYPRFSILNPELTLTLPRYQVVAGCFDIMSHIL